MLNVLKNIIIYSSLSLMFTVSTNVAAARICSFDCQVGDGGTGDPGLPNVVEFTSLDGSPLNLDIYGLILLDIFLFENLPGITIDELTPVYIGLSELPAHIALPNQFGLSVIEFSDGGASVVGVGIEYVLLRDFQSGTMMHLSTPDGVVVFDTDSIFAVPLPASIVLLLSGLVSLFTFGARKGAEFS